MSARKDSYSLLGKPAYMKEGTTANFLLKSDKDVWYKGEIYKRYGFTNPMLAVLTFPRMVANIVKGYREFFSYKFQHTISNNLRTFCVTFRKNFFEGHKFLSKTTPNDIDKYHIRLSLIEQDLSDINAKPDKPKVICKIHDESLILDSNGHPGESALFSSITSGGNFEFENSSVIRNMDKLEDEGEVPQYILDTTQNILSNIESLGELLVKHCDEAVDTSRSHPPTTHTTSSELNGVYKLSGNNGATYIGNLKNSMYDGKGVYTWPNGDTYEGDWDNGKRHGKGVFTLFANGAKYEGDWVHDKKHGKGVTTWPNGEKVNQKYTHGVLDTFVAEGGATRRHKRLTRRRKRLVGRKGKKTYRKKKYGKTKKSRRFRRSVRSRR